MFSGDRDRSLLDFLTWMGYRLFVGFGGFSSAFWPFYGLRPFCITLVYFWAA